MTTARQKLSTYAITILTLQRHPPLPRRPLRPPQPHRGRGRRAGHLRPRPSVPKERPQARASGDPRPPRLARAHHLEPRARPPPPHPARSTRRELRPLARRPQHTRRRRPRRRPRTPPRQSDENEILIALRNTLDAESKLYLTPAQNAIIVSAPPEQQALAQKLITELDRPQKTWRLTYTLAESDNGKRIGVQHFSFVLAPGQRTIVKQGSKIPVMTGSSKDPQQTQFQYLDIGMNFDATINSTPGGIFLRTKVEQSAVGSPSEYGNGSGPLASEPIIHQTSLEGSSILTPGKPLDPRLRRRRRQYPPHRHRGRRRARLLTLPGNPSLQARGLPLPGNPSLQPRPAASR